MLGSLASRVTPAVNGLANGAAGGGVGNFTSQVIDIAQSQNGSFNVTQFGTSIAVGSVAGFAGGTVAPLSRRTPSLGNSRSVPAGIRHGLLVQGNQLPITVVTNVTQLHADTAASVVACAQNVSLCPR